ncbi:MAG: hypothetical protein KF721_03875 [Ignavibacteriaceae bacterium]|nr:hypothetical protein [Ignavibacteriaceae bacterium]HRI47055.1 hypothetical protein [Ignavibacteriaceae bacterium]
MFGKASLIIVLGFSTIFFTLNSNYLRYTTDATQGYTDYYSDINASNIANSGANIACNYVFLNPSWNAGLSNISYSGGTLNVTITTLPKDRVKITSIGVSFGISKTVEVIIQPTSYSKFGNFYNKMSAAPATGDTLDGPVHTNDFLIVHGNPVFLGKTTSKKGIKKLINPSNPVFVGGYQSGVNVPHSYDPDYLKNISLAGGKTFVGVGAKSFVDVDITFNADATVTYKARYGKNKTTWDAWSAPVTTPLNILAPNGVIYIDKGNVTMRGTLSGQATVVTSKRGGDGMGMINIDNDIVYKNDPRSDPASTDMLGLVSEQSVNVTYNAARGNINIHASIYAQNEGLKIDRYGDYPTIKNMNIFGGIVANDLYPTAVYSGLNPTKGYRFIHKYDKRFLSAAPPKFPTTGTYEVISWLE